MSSATTARIAGATILVYIAASIAGTVLFDQMSNGEGTAARLANLAAHAPQIGLSYVLALLTTLPR